MSGLPRDDKKDVRIRLKKRRFDNSKGMGLLHMTNKVMSIMINHADDIYKLMLNFNIISNFIDFF